MNLKDYSRLWGFFSINERNNKLVYAKTYFLKETERKGALLVHGAPHACIIFASKGSIGALWEVGLCFFIFLIYLSEFLKATNIP